MSIRPPPRTAGARTDGPRSRPGRPAVNGSAGAESRTPGRKHDRHIVIARRMVLLAAWFGIDCCFACYAPPR